jgi:hypothetical protein
MPGWDAFLQVTLSSLPRAQPARFPFSRFFLCYTQSSAVPPPCTPAHWRTRSTSCSGVHDSRMRQRSTLSWMPGPPSAASPCFARGFPKLVVIVHAAAAEPAGEPMTMHARALTDPHLTAHPRAHASVHVHSAKSSCWLPESRRFARTRVSQTRRRRPPQPRRWWLCLSPPRVQTQPKAALFLVYWFASLTRASPWGKLPNTRWPSPLVRSGPAVAPLGHSFEHLRLIRDGGFPLSTRGATRVSVCT